MNLFTTVRDPAGAASSEPAVEARAADVPCDGLAPGVGQDPGRGVEPERSRQREGQDGTKRAHRRRGRGDSPRS